MSNYYSTSSNGFMDRALSTAKRRPEAILLFAAGCALLMTGTRRSGASYGSWSQQGDRDSNRSWRSMASDRVGQFTDTFSDATERAQGYAGDLADRARETTSTLGERASSLASTASEYASSATRYAQEAGQSLTSQASDVAGRARSTMQSNLHYLIEEQPIALGLLGLAAGAALGAALPETEMENRTLGAQRDQLARMAQKTASDQIDHLKATAGQVGERVVNAVKENAMSPDGLKQAFTDIADNFQGNAQKQNEGAAKPGNDKPMSTSASTSGATPTPTPASNPGTNRNPTGGRQA